MYSGERKGMIFSTDFSYCLAVAHVILLIETRGFIFYHQSEKKIIFFSMSMYSPLNSPLFILWDIISSPNYESLRLLVCLPWTRGMFVIQIHI